MKFGIWSWGKSCLVLSLKFGFGVGGKTVYIATVQDLKSWKYSKSGGVGKGKKTVYMATVQDLKSWKYSKSGGVGKLGNYSKLRDQKVWTR
ncbi:MAG: hypothetical protein WDO19_31105 [Bacteroidota bacterium]